MLGRGGNQVSIRFDLWCYAALFFLGYLIYAAKKASKHPRRLNSTVAIRKAYDEARIKHHADREHSLQECKEAEKKDEFESEVTALIEREYDRELVDRNPEADSINLSVAILERYGSLWHPELSKVLSFNNYFLTCLRHTSIDDYRTIVGRAYGVAFVSGAITLYRRDGRKPKIIFDEGFQLWEEDNKKDTRKYLYAEPLTWRHGVSLAKVVPFYSYGADNRNSYYEIRFPSNHQFLLVDIVNSPRNKGNRDLPTDVQEVNSMDGVPPELVYASRTTNFNGSRSRCARFFKPVSVAYRNQKFSSAVDRPKEKKNMGCY